MDGERSCRHPVLVVDDEKDIRESIRDFLEEEGYTVVTADNGRNALDLLARSVRPCVMLLDLMMPVMDGWQVLNALQADSTLADVPVVIVSAVGGKNVPPNVKAFIRKPLQPDALVDAVRAYMVTPTGS